MEEHALVLLVGVLALGVAAQWLAWRLNLPSILLLLLAGFVAGPITGFLHPDEFLGDLLFPIVSLSVALILYEGGLSLRFRELGEARGVLLRLISIGALITWALSTVAAIVFLGFSLPLALLLGSILVVTGPTVIGPLLQFVQPRQRIAQTLKWEGILIDPIGAMLAVLVFEAILSTEVQSAALLVVAGVLQTVVFGTLAGIAGAAILIVLIKYYLLPDHLQNAVSVALVISAFAVSNVLYHESGLLAVTVMGIILANQRFVLVEHIIEFKENLRVLLLAGLFILLAARLQLSDLIALGWGNVGFLLALILLVRPLSVLFSTLRSTKSWRERAFLAWMAPRGIVAAAVSSVFAIRLSNAGYERAEQLVSATFVVIVGTVAIYGLTALPVSRWLGVGQGKPKGIIIVGADIVGIRIGDVIQRTGERVLLVDNNWQKVSEARLAGLRAYYGSVLAENFTHDVDLDGYGRLLALTPNDEVNSLAALRFAGRFSRAEVYQLAPEEEAPTRTESVSPPLRGRLLFGPRVTHTVLLEYLQNGGTIRATRLTDVFDYQSYLVQQGGKSLPLFLDDTSGSIEFFTTDREPRPEPGDTLVNLVVVPHADLILERAGST